MNAKKKTLIITSLAALSVAVGAVVLSSGLISNSIYELKASEKVSHSITFTGSTVEGTTSVSTAYTQTGGVIKCVVSNNDSSISSSYVAAFKNGTVIRLYEENGVTEYTFEDVDSFSIKKSDSTTKYSFKHYYLTTGGVSGEFAWSESASQTRTPNYQNSGLDVSQFHVECTSPTSNVVYITELKINYGCTTKQLSGVSIGAAPSKTQYVVGDFFNPNGMVVNAVYNNSMEVATSAYTYSPNRALTTEDTEITISYKGYSVTQPIVVSETPVVTKPLSEILVENTFVLGGSTGTYYYELTMDFAKKLATARRCFKEDAPASLAALYTQSFEYSVDDSNNTITFTSVETPTQTGGSAIISSTLRLRQNGFISVSVSNEQVSAMTITIYNEAGTTQSSISL